MITLKLLADTNVLSYLFRDSFLGGEYRALIKGQQTGVTVLSLEELQYGITLDRWSDRKRGDLDRFLRDFFVVPMPAVVAQICGNLRAQRDRIGRPMDLADAWIAATALWYDVPLVTHDRDMEGIPGLQVLTLHGGWRVCDPKSAVQEGYLARGLRERGAAHSVSPIEH
jgi:tRNA(fMet)-specific endonuclease VapC